MHVYITQNGHEIEYDKFSKAEDAFLLKAKEAVVSEDVSTNQMIALVYGPDNPVLDYSQGTPNVTATVLAHPLYRILSDLIGVKRVALGELDLDKAHARYTIDVPSASQKLGITPQAIRAAIDANRLPGLYRKGQWWLTQESIDNYQVSNRPGRPPSVRKQPAQIEDGLIHHGVSAVTGSEAGASLSVRVDKPLIIEDREQNKVHGRFPDGWKVALIKTTTEAGTRAILIKSVKGKQKEIRHYGLFVNGEFQVIKNFNKTVDANRVWRAIAHNGFTPGLLSHLTNHEYEP